MAADSVWRKWRREVHDILEVGGSAHPAGRVVNAFIVILILLNAAAFAAETVDHLADRYGRYFDAFNVFSVAIFTIEYVLRIWSAVEIPMLSRMKPWQARLRFAFRPIMLIDLMAILPFYLQFLIPIDLRMLRVLRLFRLLMLVRYSPALQTLGRVLAEEYRALLGALLVMLVLLLFSSTAIYFLERDAQPDIFGSIPASTWWAISTLTTVGYGDAVPATPWGRVVGGIVMLLGVGMFALPIAIIAAGFSLESARHQFVATWSMVARLPLFSSMSESEIAEITKLLYTRTYAPGMPIVRAGDTGGAMYLIESGEATVALAGGKTSLLKEGDFFGEMALLENRRHKHDVVASTRCRVLVLDADSLMRLSRRHPEILAAIKQVAKQRKEAEVAVAGQNRRRKPGSADTGPKQDEPASL
jgi:voltage-gated potassium channel